MKFSDLKVGEVMSESSHYVVKQIDRDVVHLQPDNGDLITVNKGYVEAGFLTSGEQEHSKQTITRTEAAALLLANPYLALTVNYNKLVEAKEVEKEILTAHETSTPRDFSKAVSSALKRALKGVERNMVGFHRGKLDDFGRLQFIDMKVEREETEYDNRQRLVDPRTINFIILRDVRYTVK